MAVLYWQTVPRYYTPRWFRTRMLLYIGLSAYGVVPALHWIILNGGLQSPVVQVAARIQSVDPRFYVCARADDLNFVASFVHRSFMPWSCVAWSLSR